VECFKDANYTASMTHMYETGQNSSPLSEQILSEHTRYSIYREHLNSAAKTTGT